MLKIIGTAITDEHWRVMCKNCGNYIEFEGFLDSEYVCVCDKCNTEFQIPRIVFENGSYIK